MNKMRLIFGFLLAFVGVVGLATPGQCIAQKLLQEGGPYVSGATGKIERFTATLQLPAEGQSAPMWLTFYNGLGRKPGFSWVRVFLSSSTIGGAQTGYGDILADERTFLHKNAVTINVSGLVTADNNQLLIEGEGEKGAEFTWVLTTVKDQLSVLDSSPVLPGKECLIHGTGFSTNPADNKVTIDGKPAEVLEATNRLLTVKAPDNVADSGSVPLSVSVGSLTSNSIRAAVAALPPHLLSMSPYGGPVGGVLNITGTHFAANPEGNVVTIGPFKAQVIKASKDALTVSIPDWSTCGGTLPVKVISNGVSSDNHLEFWCTSHYYGGDPNADVYAYD